MEADRPPSPRPGRRRRPAGAAGAFMSVANAAPSGSPDPQVNYTLQEWQLLIFSHDGLVGFQAGGGPEGAKLVPDLATSVPTPADSGKTYEFTLRNGNQVLERQGSSRRRRQGDLRAACRRSATARTRAPQVQGDQGGGACIKDPASCNLWQGHRGRRREPSDVPPERGRPGVPLDKISVPFAFILPADRRTRKSTSRRPAPARTSGRSTTPTSQMKLVRNPYFKEWSKDAQPAGLRGRDRLAARPQADAQVTQSRTARPTGCSISRRPTASTRSAPSTRTGAHQPAHRHVLLF